MDLGLHSGHYLQLELNPNMTSQSEPHLEKYAEEGYTLHFKDGSTSTCDVLVGADGISSPVRRAMLDFASRDTKDDTLLAGVSAVWSLHSFYRALVPMDVVRENIARLGGKVGEEPEGKDRPIMVRLSSAWGECPQSFVVCWKEKG